jgi:PilZ domain
VYLPLQVCVPQANAADFRTAQLRDISRSGIYFQSDAWIEPGTRLELTFALPAERDGGTSVLVRASAMALRISEVERELAPIYGVAASIDRIDFVRPVVSNAA